MFQRLLSSAAMLIATIVAYQAYVLVAVPWLEPPLAEKVIQPVSQAELDRGGTAIAKYQHLLSEYFPADHWSLARPPKVIESGPVMLVLDDYERHDDGRVDLTHFAFLIFPTPRQQSATPPRDAIILEAPQGARLQFDKNFRPERGQIGQITRGEFPGRITIRSDMHEPGPEDDLLIETSDLEMNSKLLFTQSEVRLRLGPNTGGGHELEIRFMEDDQAESQSGGLKIAGVDSLEIRREVKLRAYLGTDSLLPGDGPQDSSKDKTADNQRKKLRRLPASGDPSLNESEGVELATAIELGDTSQPPVEVTCAGPFRFDFVSYIASFDRDVEVWQVNPSGQSDQLSCQQLDIHFTPKSAETGPANAALDASRRQRQDIGRLEPDKLVAQGHPVVIISPSREAEVRGDRVQLMLQGRKVAIDGGRSVTLSYGPNIIRAPTIVYQHPASDATTKIGSFRADGPGTLRYVPDPKKPEQIFQASWQASVELGRYNGQPVLTIAGRPRMLVTEMGQLTADQIRVYLRELEVDGKTRPMPDRMNAVGQVEIDSPELLARTRQLVANFQQEPADTGRRDGTGSPRPLERSGGMGRFNLSRTRGSSSRVYQIVSDDMQLDVALRGRHAAPVRLSCNGNVAFRELPSMEMRDGPLEVRGAQLVADGLDDAVHITIRGVADSSAGGTEVGTGIASGAQLTSLAQISARGLVVRAPDVQLDEAQNRLWIEGPGKATLSVSHDMAGRISGTPYPVEITWQGGLNFDGRAIAVERNVLVQGADDTVHCDALVGRLTIPIRFGERVDQEAIDLAEVECRGHVKLDHVSRDATGLTSHERMEIAQLLVHQKTGAISGEGPGVIRSTHFAAQLDALAGPGAGRGASQAPNTQLHFLRVDFQGSLVGNLTTREIEFRRRVRAVYGPVDAWEQEIDLDRPETMPPGALTLTSDKLGVNEDPLSATRATARGLPFGGRSLGPMQVQMRAEGNVRIDGSSPAQGTFAAMAERAAYEQSKELFILEGTDRAPATLWFQKQVGGQFARNDARKIQFQRLTNQVQVEGVQLFEFTPGGTPGPPPSPPQRAQGQSPARR